MYIPAFLNLPTSVSEPFVFGRQFRTKAVSGTQSRIYDWAKAPTRLVDAQSCLSLC